MVAQTPASAWGVDRRAKYMLSLSSRHFVVPAMATFSVPHLAQFFREKSEPDTLTPSKRNCKHDFGSSSSKPKSRLFFLPNLRMVSLLRWFEQTVFGRLSRTDRHTGHRTGETAVSAPRGGVVKTTERRIGTPFSRPRSIGGGGQRHFGRRAAPLDVGTSSVAR